ncbi:Heterokaryon incompatibility protein (HET) domain containing protein [Rhypophila decipiens]
MRLINTKTFKLVDIIGRLPEYGILSHCWRRGEVSYHDYGDAWRRRHGLEGRTKVRDACKQAYNDGLEFLWVDTCCIDKTSSAELGEAINSMYTWYRKAAKCYVYLDDVVSSGSPSSSDCAEVGSDASVRSLLAQSRWFTRGWTLQELLAPKNASVGEKSSLVDVLHRITGIDRSVLEGGPLRQVSVGRRMSWAAARETTRIEDIAYCLLGIFDVNMPLLYGEGRRAFIRLQKEIIKTTEDQTLLAWQCTHNSRLERPVRGLLATSPADFACFAGPMTLHAPMLFGQPLLSVNEETRRVYVKEVATPVPFRDFNGSANSLVAAVSRGLRITAAVEDLWPTPMDSILLGLNCSVDGRLTKAVGIYLQRHDGDRYVRVRPDELGICPAHSPRRTIYGLQTEDEIEVEIDKDPPGLDAPNIGEIPVSGTDIQPAELFRRRSSLQHAFYISHATTPVPWTTYYVSAVFSKGDCAASGSSKIFHHPLGPGKSHCAIAIESDWKTRGGQFRAGVLVRGRLAAESILIVVGADWSDKEGNSVLIYEPWFDVVTFPNKLSTPKAEEMECLIAEMSRPTNPFTEKTIPLQSQIGTTQSSMIISVQPAKVQGLDMFRIAIHGKTTSDDEDVSAPWSGFPFGQGLLVVSKSSRFFVPVQRAMTADT